MKKLLLAFLLLSELTFGQNLLVNGDFEFGDDAPCGCAVPFTCYNDASRVVDGVHPEFSASSMGCVIQQSGYTNPLKAHSGEGYMYLYAGSDYVSQTPSYYFPADTTMVMCVWYCGPQAYAALGQSTSSSYFSFSIDLNRVGSNVQVSANTLWTQYSLEVAVDSGYHSFDIRSGGAAAYSIWFDDFSVGESCTTFTGINEAERGQNSLSLYPNPTSSTITLQTATSISHAWLTNLAGKRLMQMQSNGTQWQADLSALPAGIYLVEAFTNDGVRAVNRVIRE